jgi:tetratricopeptide (TPR) repeat protein
MRRFGTFGGLLTSAGLLWLLGNSTSAPTTKPGPAAASSPSTTQTPTATQPTLERAKALKDAGFRDAAVAELQRWIVATSTNSLPKEFAVLYDLLPTSLDNLQRARVLRDSGQRAAAAVEVQKWLQVTGRSEIPYPYEDLGSLLPGVPEAGQRLLHDVVLAWVVLLAEVLAGLIVLALLLLRLARVGRPYLVTSDFEAGDVDAALGRALSAHLRQALAQAQTLTSGATLTMASGPIEPVALPADVISAVSKEVPLATAIDALIRWLSPWRIVTVSGWLHKLGDRGAGLTLTIAQGRTVAHSVTFWQADFEPDWRTASPPSTGPSPTAAPAPYYALVRPAVTWLQFTLHEDYGPAAAGPLVLEGTSRWRSYACFLAGVSLANRGRTEAAAVMYEQALGLDAMNTGARLNLALQLKTRSNLTETISQLEWIVGHTARPLAESSFYSATFSLVMLLVEAGRRVEAAARARTLMRSIAQARQERRQRLRRHQSADDPLLTYLSVIEPSAGVMWAALAAPDDDVANDTLAQLLSDAWRPSLEFQYNLACYYSLKNGAQNLESALAHLAFASRLHARRVSTSAIDDLTLANVRTNAGTQGRFHAICGAAAPDAPTPRSTLALLTVMGTARADALVALGITTAADLIVTCATLQRAAFLAVQLEVSLETVLRWARVAELLRLSGITPAQVNTLTKAGADSLANLRGATPSTLGDLFADWQDAGIAAPAIGALDQWAIEINTMPALVPNNP